MLDQAAPTEVAKTDTAPAPSARNPGGEPRPTTSDRLDRDTECMAKVVHHEAANQPLTGQLAVAEVIINRVHSGRYAATPCAVANQRGQFFQTDSYHVPLTSPRWRTAVAVARIAQAGERPPVAEGALFFHASYARTELVEPPHRWWPRSPARCSTGEANLTRRGRRFTAGSSGRSRRRRRRTAAGRAAQFQTERRPARGAVRPRWSVRSYQPSAAWRMTALVGVGARVSAQDFIEAALKSASTRVITAMTLQVQPSARSSSAVAGVSSAITPGAWRLRMRCQRACLRPS